MGFYEAINFPVIKWNRYRRYLATGNGKKRRDFLLSRGYRLRYKAARSDFTMIEKSGCKPEIAYPCRWQYRIIGEDRAAMHRAITTSVAAADCTIKDANVSSSGRYLSLSLEVTVHTDAERLQLYRLLAGHPAIRMVL
jgi:putative lipoic acid-binding regulatory protein